MTTWLITLIALWTYPIVSFIVIRLTRNKPKIRKRIIWYLILTNLIAAFGLLTNISTTLKELDWVIVTSFYFTICFLLWLGFQQKNTIVKILSVLVMVCVFGIGYLSGTIGALGVGFVTAEYDTRIEMWLGDGIIYKETTLGNAVSDYRGKRVEIYKTIPWLPLIEWRTEKKVYKNYITYMTSPLTVKYKPEEKKIYLSASMWWQNEHKQVEWSDTLSIER
jgi:hypothetical protein